MFDLAAFTSVLRPFLDSKELVLDTFEGYHSEWNLGSPGGWDYQKTTQIIGKAIWQKLSQHLKTEL
jgi:hypothetical protein